MASDLPDPAAGATSGPPAIPMPLQHMPTHGGLVVPWITARGDRGQVLFGTVDGRRVRASLRNQWCGVCAAPLGDRLVLMMRLSDLVRQCTVEPPLHPWCAAYSIAACPMLHGWLTHYRASPPPLGPSASPATHSAARCGAAAEPWFAVWLTGYRLGTVHGHLAAAYSADQVVQIRPVPSAPPGGAPAGVS